MAQLFADVLEDFEDGCKEKFAIGVITEESEEFVIILSENPSSRVALDLFGFRGYGRNDVPFV